MVSERLDNEFVKLKGRIRNINIFSFDIETFDSNKKFLLGSIYGNNYKNVFFDKKIMVSEILNNELFRN
jgi:hypothetical protein